MNDKDLEALAATAKDIAERATFLAELRDTECKYLKRQVSYLQAMRRDACKERDAALAKLQVVRNEALEEAARVADQDASNLAYEGYTYIARRIAESVRALKEHGE